MFSGGLGSYLAAKRVVAKHGSQFVTLLFADTLIEDKDLYRFLTEASVHLGCELITLRDGRTPWQVFKEKRFLGNSRVDICSRILKREPCQKWLSENCDPKSALLYVGIDWTESHRFERIKQRNTVWTYLAPLCDPPYLSPDQARAEVLADGIRIPDLYIEGFSHNNCGGFCVKAGQAHFANLLKTRPNAYAYHESEEQEMRKFLGKDVSILADRMGGGPKRPLTLQAFRERKQAGGKHDQLEWGGCGCFAGDAGAP